VKHGAHTTLRGLALAAAALSACDCSSDPENDQIRILELDYSRFKLEVMPVFASACSNPSCHAREERPLSLYAPLAWRLDTTRTFRLEPLSEPELEHNYVVSCALATEAEHPSATLLLRKPLAEHASTYHGGGAIFEGTSDERWRVLEAWVADGWNR
jgi:hypothetical protein